MNAVQEDLCTKADQTVETLHSQDGQARFDFKLNADQEDLCTKVHKSTERFQSKDEQSNAEKEDLSTGAQHFSGNLPNQNDQSNADEEDPCSASIHEYLDSCFPAAQPEPEPQRDAEPEPEPSPERSNKKSSPAVPSTSVQTQYLSTWTLSQALILRGRRDVQSGSSPEKTPPPRTPPKHTPMPPSTSSSTPELFSPAPPTQSPAVSPPGSMELFYEPFLTQRTEEGGVVLEATPDGVLCSQGAERQELEGVEPRESRVTPQSQATKTAQTAQTAQTSPSKSPDHKRARMSEGFTRTEASPPPPDGAGVGLQGLTSLLIRCVKPGVRYSVLVAVVHPCHLKEIKVKSGASAGSFVPLASIVVTDQSGVEMKVVLWRRAAFWALTVQPGDLLLITGLQVNEDRWRGETVLQSTYSSRLLNLGQITATASPPVPQHVNARSLRSLCVFLRARRPLLASLPPRVVQNLNRLPYAPLRSLRVGALVHALLRVTHTDMSAVWRSGAESRSRSAVQLKAVLAVEQPGGQQGAVVLWGAALDWLPRFSRDRASVWDFRFLLVREGLTSDLPELHSTPWSSARPLDPADRRALDFRSAGPVRTGNTSLELDLDTLLSQKYSGDVELRVHITAFQFQDGPPSQNAPQQVLDSSAPPDGIVAALSGDVTYTGCGRCAAELDTDDNGIYRPCYPCLPRTAVRRYYRPGVLTVKGGGSQLCVQVPPVLLQKILNAPPDKLHKTTGSEVRFVQQAAERILALLSLPRKTFILTVRSHFLCDENSVPTARDVLLLDLQFPAD
uniref:shieldin complex subunit 2 isoform X2 n=1 Tax=Centroberyx gerrardi TaxID=166262 RepID=UPI003AB09178